MKGGARRGIILSLVVVAAALAVLVVWLGFASRKAGGEVGLAEFAIAIVVIVGGFALWHVFSLVDRHFRDLDRLRGAVVTLAGNTGAVLPLREPGEESAAEIDRFYGALADLAARHAEERTMPDRRLGAVLASVSEALVVITESGQVSLVNYPAKVLLDAERVRVGTSVFASLEREPVFAAVERARRAGQSVSVTLKTVGGIDLPARVASLDEHGGAVLSFPAEDAEYRAEIEHDLELHDRPPAVRPVSDETPLSELHLTVMDTETTGLDTTTDRVISIGAVRVYGGRIYRSAEFDRLVHPGVPIPPRSTAVHGITDAMIIDAKPFPEVYDDFTALAGETILVGHNVAFDVAMLRGECARAGLPWRDPPVLDTLLLASALSLDSSSLSLEALAGHFGVNVRGRHTALGDSLVTAEIYVRMLPLLLDAGVSTFGAAVAFSQRAKEVIARQKAAGW